MLKTFKSDVEGNPQWRSRASTRAARINRTGLYQIASPEGNLALHPLVAVLEALGMRLSIKAAKFGDETHKLSQR